MSPETQRIAIATACGWKGPDSPEVKERTQNWTTRYSQRHFIDPYGFSTGIYAVPNYLASLDAMHEAEKVLTFQQQEAFAKELIKPFQPDFESLHATAPQRAEAFLRCLSLWQDEPPRGRTQNCASA